MRSLLHAALLAVSLVALSPSAARGQLIPPDRRLDWGRSFIGVPGGIPNRTDIYCNVRVRIPGSDLVAKGDNTTDDSAALNAAIASCPANKVVYIPAGDYVCKHPLNIIKDNITIRGDGPKTVLHGRMQSSSWAFITVGGYLVNSADYLAVVSGATKGSTKIAVPTVPESVSANKATILLSQANDYPYVRRLIYTTERVPDPVGKHNMSLTAWVTGTTATSITFWPPLPFDLKNGPVSYKYFAGRGAIRTGLEDLKIVCDTPATFNVLFDRCYGCWVKNLESAYTSQAHIYAVRSVCCEFKDSYVHDFFGKGGGNNGEGIELYSDCSGCLIENNIIHHCFPGINTSGSSSGNVIAYNFGCDSRSGSSVIGNDFDANHGPHNVMNLWEGNVGTMFQSDGYYGSASHITVFRNHFSGVHPGGLTQHRICVDLTHWSTYFNIVGNVLGVSGWKDSLPTRRSGDYSSTDKGYAGHLPVIYRFGFPNMGNNDYTEVSTNPTTARMNDLDDNVLATTLLLGNFDYYHNETMNPVKELPPSLFYTSTPDWWPSKIPWPPIGPDLTPMVSRIPAQVRFDSLTQAASQPPK